MSDKPEKPLLFSTFQCILAMKYTFLFLLFLFAVSTGIGQGIQFEPAHTLWDSILQKAAAEKKIIFVSAYSNSCHNCRHMMDSIYPDAAIGRVFNDKYINVKIDLDAAANEAFAVQYQIFSYPTYLFFDEKGVQLHRVAGAKTVAEMLEIGAQASEPEFQYYRLKARFENGDRSVDLLRRLTFMSESLSDFRLLDSVHTAFLATQSDWLEPENMKALFAGVGSIEQAGFRFLLEHRAEFARLIGETKVGERIDKIILDDLSMRSYDHEQRDFDLASARAYATKFLPEAQVEKAMSLFEVNQFKRKGMTPEFLTAAAQYFDTYPCYNPVLLNNIALDFYQQTSDKVLLEKALAWSLNALKLSEGYTFYDTAAALYHKLGDIKNAKVYAHKAIDFAKRVGIDPHETIALLEQME